MLSVERHIGRIKTVTVEKLERVMWRVRKNNPNKTRIKHIELRRAIMFECGTSPATYKNNRRALVILGWIKSDKNHVRLTDEDLRGG